MFFFMRSAVLADNQPDETVCFIGVSSLAICFILLCALLPEGGFSVDGFINPKRRFVSYTIYV